MLDSFQNENVSKCKIMFLRIGVGRRQPPAYSVAAQMARLHRLGRAHSHEGVTQGFHYHNDPDADQGINIVKVSTFFV